MIQMEIKDELEDEVRNENRGGRGEEKSTQ